MRPNCSQDDFVSELKILMDNNRKVNDGFLHKIDELTQELAKCRVERMALKQSFNELLSIVKDLVCDNEKAHQHQVATGVLPRRQLDLIARRK